MKNIIRLLRLLPVVLVISIVLSGIHANAQAGPPAVDVEIINPLPLPVTGTVTVDGVPSDVTINNPADNPVVVQDVNFREPVQFGGIPTFFDGGFGSVELVTVPEDRYLVIEHVSGLVNENTGSGLSSCFLSSTGIGDPTDWMPCIPMASNALNNFYAASHTTKYLAAPGSTVRFSTTTLGFAGEGFISGFVSGYYVPVE